MGRAAADLDPGRADFGKALGVVGRGGKGVGEVVPDLALGDVEGGDKLDIGDVIAAEVEMHDPGDRGRAGRVPVEFDALHQGRGAVPDPDQRHPDFRQQNLPADTAR